jgi:hypothetical protein
MKERIAEGILAEDSNALPGSRAFLLHYQKQCSKVIMELTEEEKGECERLVQEWNTNGPDPEAKAL